MTDDPTLYRIVYYTQTGTLIHRHVVTVHGFDYTRSKAIGLWRRHHMEGPVSVWTNSGECVLSPDEILGIAQSVN